MSLWNDDEPEQPSISDDDMERILDTFAGMTMRERIDTLPRFEPDWTLEKDGPPVSMFKKDDGEWVRRGDVEMMLERELRVASASALSPEPANRELRGEGKTSHER